ncbi:MAG: sodium:alanine symporter family protein [Magnetococcales bacterium]|nr:sodium:alanine symporter family protein [Magnetococcales bacterium]
MAWIAAWIWNPFLSLVYLEVGLLFLLLTRGLSWRRPWGLFRELGRGQPAGEGERVISHRRAFIAALATSIGVGNLAGVATAIHLGGPGALFWMWMTAITGNAFRMCSTYLAIQHGPSDPNSPLFATPMAYLDKFLPRSWKWLGSFLAGMILVKGLVTANLIQSNSVAHAVVGEFGLPKMLVALVLFGLVAVVVVGGLRSILNFSVLLAPWMMGLYLGAGLWILLSDPARTMGALGEVWRYAFQPYSAAGGLLGYGVMQAMQFGVSRGVFSHNSGMGVAPFLHGANRDHPARGAMFAALVPMVDTLIVCSVTGLVVLSVGNWHEWTGAYLTVNAFQSALGDGGRGLVVVCLMLFAFTTMINWAYFSERCYEYLGGRNIKGYRWFFAGVTFLGPFFPVAFIWSVGDILIGVILIVHLLPLTMIVIKQLPELKKVLT